MNIFGPSHPRPCSNCLLAVPCSQVRMHTLLLPVVSAASSCIMRFGSTTKVLAERMLNYYSRFERADACAEWLQGPVASLLLLGAQPGMELPTPESTGRSSRLSTLGCVILTSLLSFSQVPLRTAPRRVSVQRKHCNVSQFAILLSSGSRV